MPDNEIIYEVHVPTESPELAGKVMRAAGALGSYAVRIYAIEDGRRRPVRQKEFALVLLGATEFAESEPPRARPSRGGLAVVGTIRSTLGVVKRALLGQITP